MHHAKRSVRIVRPGARTSATAAKPVYNAPGKWGRPESLPVQTLSSTTNPNSVPDVSKWKLQSPPTNQEQPTYSGFRSSGTPGGSQAVSSSSGTRFRRGDNPASLNNYSRSESRARTATKGGGFVEPGSSSGRGSFSDTLRSGSSRQPQPPRSQHDSLSFLRKATPGTGRGPGPHQTLDRSKSLPPHLAGQQVSRQPSNKPNPLDFLNHRPKLAPLKDLMKNDQKSPQIVDTAEDHEIADKNEVKAEAAANEVPVPPPRLFVDPEMVAATFDTQNVSGRTRNPKSSRVTFKERRSLVSHADMENVAIPGHSRKKTTIDAFRERRKGGNSRKEIKAANVDIYIPTVISVSNLARLLNVRLGTLKRKMVQAGMSADTSHDHMLSSDYSSLLAMEFGRNPVVDDEAAFDIHPPPIAKDKAGLPSRPPVVTIMGHVDHGKTTLLDTLRSTSVAKGEAGGITQHIGAFSVPVKGEVNRTITFLDTPGHAAFSAMRARGAGVTDIVVLVIAADDGIMPQTREVLDLVRKDGDKVGLVIAINKVDKPGADVEKVETALLAEGVQLESLGGDVPCVHVSGLTGHGLDQLIETISLLAEMQDVRAEKEGPVHGYVLESKVQKGLGPVATVLLMRGVLTPGQHLICGNTHAKIRLLTSPSGAQVRTVYPGEPVVVSGWKDLPGAGDDVLNGTEADVKKALANRIRKAEIEATLQDVEVINVNRREERGRREEELQAKRGRRGQNIVMEAEAETPEEEQQKELRILLKGDVSGSVEAVAGALQGIGNHLACVKIVAMGVGDVTESDVMRAKAVDGMIVAFSVKAPKTIESAAAGQSISILSSSVIYRLMDQIKEQVIKLLPVTIETRVKGEATVQEIFDIHLKAKKIMKVAGCRVTNGIVEKKQRARVIRHGDTVHEGQLDTFRHLKKDITEAGKGLECGMSLENFSDLRPGDMIQMYEEIEIPGSL